MSDISQSENNKEIDLAFKSIEEKTTALITLLDEYRELIDMVEPALKDAYDRLLEKEKIIINQQRAIDLLTSERDSLGDEVSALKLRLHQFKG